MENKLLDKRLVAVPAGRLARLGYITTVTASVAGSMAVGGMSQLMKRQRPVIKDLLLTPQNIFRITEAGKNAWGCDEDWTTDLDGCW